MEIISYRPNDDQFWIGCSKEEAERYFVPLLKGKDLEYYKSMIVRQKYTPDYVSMVKSCMEIEELSYAYFNVSRNLDLCYYDVPHHPFHQLWNAYSLFRRCKHVVINSLEELKDIEIALLQEDD